MEDIYKESKKQYDLKDWGMNEFENDYNKLEEQISELLKDNLVPTEEAKLEIEKIRDQQKANFDSMNEKQIDRFQELMSKANT